MVYSRVLLWSLTNTSSSTAMPAIMKYISFSYSETMIGIEPHRRLPVFIYSGPVPLCEVHQSSSSLSPLSWGRLLSPSLSRSSLLTPVPPQVCFHHLSRGDNRLHTQTPPPHPLICPSTNPTSPCLSLCSLAAASLCDVIEEKYSLFFRCMCVSINGCMWCVSVWVREWGRACVWVCDRERERRGGGGGFDRKNERKARVSGFPFQLKGSTPCF